MSTPASNTPPQGNRTTAGSGTGLPTTGPGRPPAGAAGRDAVVVTPADVPVSVEVVVPAEVVVAVAAPQQWSGVVIDAAPTTADDIAALVLAVPDVARLHAGRFGEVATYLPGRRVTGISVGDDLIEVHVVLAGQAPVRETAQRIHAAVATLTATPVHVYVEDLTVD